MAQCTTQRRVLSSTGPPELKKHHPKIPDPILTSKPFHVSKLNPNHKVSSTTQKSTKNKETQLQTKAMTVAADFDASRLSLLFKPNHHQPQQRKIIGRPKIYKQDATSEEKVNKVSSKVQQVVGSERKSRKKEVKELLLERYDIKMSISLGGGRRMSICGSQVDSGAKVVSVDMPSLMQIHAVDCARKTCDSLERFTSRSLALTLKKEFDGVYGPAWHCVVGTSFGSFVTQSARGFLYFSLDQKLYILLFKTTVQRAH